MTDDSMGEEKHCHERFTFDELMKEMNCLIGEEIKIQVPLNAVIYDVLVEAMKKMEFPPGVKEGSLAVVDSNGNMIPNQTMITSLALQPQDCLLIAVKKQDLYQTDA
jgi:hypothetical protein